MPGPSAGESMEAEFDTVAAWTEDAVAELGRDHAIPAACRGSGSPADLTWIAERLGLTDSARFLDAGSGLGGPAAWLVEERGWPGRPILADPMTHAVAAGHRMFGLPSVVAWTESLPLADGVVDAAWSLGVLCTTDERRRMLAELHRVLRPGAKLGLLVLVAETDPLPESPEGNDFPTHASLAADLAAAGFRVDAQVDAATLPGAPRDWSERAERVEEIVTRDHAHERAWREADENQAIMGRLIARRHVVTMLLTLTR